MKRYLIPLTLLLAAALFAFPAAAAITADFSYTVDSSNPLTIHFTEKSTGGAGNWFWMFNDGGAVSNERNPTFTFSSEGTYMVSCVAQASDYSEEDTMRKQLTITSGGVTDDSSGSSSGGSSSGGQSGGSSGGGISFPDISFGGISIPNPLDLISEYIKLIRVMVIPGNYNF